MCKYVIGPSHEPPSVSMFIISGSVLSKHKVGIVLQIPHHYKTYLGTGYTCFISF